MQHDTRYQQVKRITLIGAMLNFLLSLLKLVFGTLAGSHALVADGVHSLSDLLTDALVLLTAKFACREADRAHPYGHERIETVGSVALAVILIIVSLGLIVEALTQIHGNEMKAPPGQMALIVAIFSVLTNEWLYHATLRVGRKVQSAMLQANAWHHRSDALSSVVVIVGLIGTTLGWLYFDAVAAIIVALMILKMAFSIGKRGIAELIDTALDDEGVALITQVINSVPGVRELHQLRTRRMGASVLIDVHVLVDPCLSVSEGHYIGDQVQAHLFSQVANVSDVIVHVDPEDDEINPSCVDLPVRKVVRESLADALKALSADDLNHAMKHMRLHYLEGALTIECQWDMNILAQYPSEEILTLLAKVRAQLPYARSITPVFVLSDLS